jgi:eukaryotic-like serine/threonine-protein kinase
VPAALKTIVESALAKDPAQRPPDATAFASALRKAIGPDVVPTAPMPVTADATQVLAAPPATPAAMFDDDHDRRRRAGWLPIAAVVIAVLLIAGIAYALSTGGDGGDNSGSPAAAGTKRSQQSTDLSTTAPSTTPPSTTPETTPATTTTPAGIVVDPNDYIGLKSKDAEHQLEDLGFHVELDETSGGEKDVVADITPSGTLQEGETVTLIIYTGDESGHGGGHGNGNGKGD